MYIGSYRVSGQSSPAGNSFQCNNARYCLCPRHLGLSFCAFPDCSALHMPRLGIQGAIDEFIDPSQGVDAGQASDGCLVTVFCRIFCEPHVLHTVIFIDLVVGFLIDAGLSMFIEFRGVQPSPISTRKHPLKGRFVIIFTICRLNEYSGYQNFGKFSSVYFSSRSVNSISGTA
jgi:hypothetical protein